ncbi:MAG: Mur ligase family protein [Bacteroidota bacterium]
MKVHFIAMGGSVMHSLAIALAKEGHHVTGSDDAIYDPARSRLAEHNLLPESEGWHPEHISADLDAVILGMHAFADNPELKRAQELGVKVYSFPEFIHEQSLHKQRIVVTGSFGKTTVTSMLMHVLKKAGKDFDYLVGAQVPGFDNSVKITKEAPLLVVEGDEYLASRLDPRPKFLLYKPHIIVLNGIDWDHVNVFPTEQVYIDAFTQLMKGLPKAGSVIYNQEDPIVDELVESEIDSHIHYGYPFTCPNYRVENGEFQIKRKRKRKWEPVKVVGKHNLMNLAAAAEVCSILGIEISEFMGYIADFRGPDLRLQVLQDDEEQLVIRDYAHAPEKVRASVAAIREQYPNRRLIALAELHTFSSLNESFLPRYKGALAPADVAAVLARPEEVSRKRLPEISAAQIQQGFGQSDLQVFATSNELSVFLKDQQKPGDVVLMMSSGNFGGMLG